MKEIGTVKIKVNFYDSNYFNFIWPKNRYIKNKSKPNNIYFSRKCISTYKAN